MLANFYAYDFEFDGQSSQLYDMKIISFDDGGLFSGVGSSDVEIYTQKVLRKAKSYYLGRSQQKVLEFDLTFGSARPISGLDRDVISAWMFGKSSFKPLRILQDDLNGAWFNCFLTKPEPQYIGGINYAFKCTVVCDSPFAYSFPRTITETFDGDENINKVINIYNNSSEDDYLYPIVSFELNLIGSNFLIKNNTDNGREFYFQNLYPHEKIVIDNDLQTIVSSTGLHRLSNFNKKWFRLVPRLNNLTIQSGIGTYTITYTERLKIGG